MAWRCTQSLVNFRLPALLDLRHRQQVSFMFDNHLLYFRGFRVALDQVATARAIENVESSDFFAFSDLFQGKTEDFAARWLDMVESGVSPFPQVALKRVQRTDRLRVPRRDRVAGAVPGDHGAASGRSAAKRHWRDS
jgi:hypothetical protein